MGCLLLSAPLVASPCAVDFCPTTDDLPTTRMNVVYDDTRRRRCALRVNYFTYLVTTY